MKEKNVFHVNGFIGLICVLILLILGGYMLWNGSQSSSVLTVISGSIVIILDLLFASSLTIIQPNEAKVLTFFWSIYWYNPHVRIIHDGAFNRQADNFFAGA